MPAPISQLDTVVASHHRNPLKDAQIETLFFIDLNNESDKPDPDEGELPEELTGFYYTG